MLSVWRRRPSVTITTALLAAALELAPLAAYSAEPTTASGTISKTVKDNLLDAAKKMGLTASGKDNRSILDLFGVYLALTLGFVGIIFIVQVVHGGYLWMTAGGNEEQVTKARQKIANGAMGAAVIFFAYILTSFLLSEFASEAGIPF